MVLQVGYELIVLICFYMVWKTFNHIKRCQGLEFLLFHIYFYMPTIARIVLKSLNKDCT